MNPPHTVPELSTLFVDPRGGERALRVSWHQERDVVVLSLWRDDVCAASFRLDIDEVPDLIAMLREGLDLSFAAHRHEAHAQGRDQSGHRSGRRSGGVAASVADAG